MMTKLQELEKNQEKATKTIQALQDENRQLREELRRAKSSSPTKKVKKSKDLNKKEESLMLQLESSIVNLAEKVQNLEEQRGGIKTPSSTSPSKKTSITDQLTQQLSDVWSFASSPKSKS